MKVKVRTLKNAEVEIEVEKTNTIAQTKVLVHEKISQLPADKQVLIHAGAVLLDAKTVGDYRIKEGDRLVVMQSKKTTQPTEESKTADPVPSTAKETAGATDASASNSVSTRSDAATQQPQTTTTSVTTQSTEISTAPSTNTSTETTTTTTTNTETTSEVRTDADPPSSLLVEQIVSMGFTRSDVEVALQAAFLNPERAVEYLMNGIPPELIATATPTRDGVHSDAPLQMPPQPTAGGEAPAGTEGALSSIRRHPLFNQMRRAIQANPELLPQMLASIMEQNPRLAEQIAANRDEFLQLLGESDEEVTGAGAPPGDGGRAEDGGGRGSIQIHLTTAEIEAVQRLEALGFRREMAVQAYIACEKNEDMAANWLFDNIADLMDDADHA
eukprot:Lankesteria_metandrocarpae@DN2060_c0_g1_i1.p1